ncbi:Uncharacterised protein [Staphylococcus aureus]|nr:Uncharacterised protein [Staphylococcus aureus]
MFVPCMPFNQVVNPSNIPAIGAPITKMNINPTRIEDIMGMIIIGIIGAIALGILTLLIHFAI